MHCARRHSDSGIYSSAAAAENENAAAHAFYHLREGETHEIHRRRRDRREGIFRRRRVTAASAKTSPSGIWRMIYCLTPPARRPAVYTQQPGEGRADPGDEAATWKTAMRTPLSATPATRTPATPTAKKRPRACASSPARRCTSIQHDVIVASTGRDRPGAADRAHRRHGRPLRRLLPSRATAPPRRPAPS